MADLVRRHFPGIYVALSSEVWPEFHECERASTTVMSVISRPLCSLGIEVGGFSGAFIAKLSWEHNSTVPFLQPLTVRGSLSAGSPARFTPHHQSTATTDAGVVRTAAARQRASARGRDDVQWQAATSTPDADVGLERSTRGYGRGS